MSGLRLRGFASALFMAGLVGIAALSPAANAQVERDGDGDVRASENDRPFELMVGDKAPTLRIAEWVKGDSVSEFESGKVYLVEFWATWCGPCIRAMPHLTELQKKYQDEGLTVVAVTAEDRRNTLQAVRDFVEKNEAKTGFRVAWDDGGKTYLSYMQAAGKNGIPATFLVDRSGRIAYMGHPMNVDATLQEVMEGTFDTDRAAKDYERQLRIGKRVAELQREIMNARREQDWDVALSKVDELVALDESMHYAAAFKLHLLVNEMKERERGYDYAEASMNGFLADNAMVLAQMGAVLVQDKESLDERGLDLAERLVTRVMGKAAELPDDQRAMVYMAGANVAEARGDLNAAVQRQEQALEAAESLPQAQGMRTRLEELRKKRDEG